MRARAAATCAPAVGAALYSHQRRPIRSCIPCIAFCFGTRPGRANALKIRTLLERSRYTKVNANRYRTLNPPPPSRDKQSKTPGEPHEGAKRN